jgi:hypothetical protein
VLINVVYFEFLTLCEEVVLIHAIRFKVKEFDILQSEFILIVGLNSDKFPES